MYHVLRVNLILVKQKTTLEALVRLYTFKLTDKRTDALIDMLDNDYVDAKGGEQRLAL